MSAVHISTDGRVDATAFGWHCRGRLYVTVAVRARFAFVDGREATRIDPGADADASSMRGRVPYRPRCDVTFVGSAHPVSPAATMMVRLAVMRAGRAVLDKSMRVVGPRSPDGSPLPFAEMPLTFERTWGGPDSANPVGTTVPNVIHPHVPREPIGFAPVPRRGSPPPGLERPVPVLAESVPWTFFQSAPADQQIGPLAGDETLVLEGLVRGRPRFETKLPRGRGAAIARLPGAAGLVRSLPFDLACDELAIDGERGAFDLVWRGRLDMGPSANEAAVLPALHVEAAFATPLADESTVAGVGLPELPLPFPSSTGPARPPTAEGTPWGEGALDAVVPARPGEDTLAVEESPPPPPPPLRESSQGAALAESLRRMGASEAEIADLVAALAPPSA